MLELKGITKIYKTKNQEVRALNGDRKSVV